MWLLVLTATGAWHIPLNIEGSFAWFVEYVAPSLCIPPCVASYSLMSSRGYQLVPLGINKVSILVCPDWLPTTLTTYALIIPRLPPALLPPTVASEIVNLDPM